MKEPRAGDRFLALLLLGLFAFSPPLLSIFSVRRLLLGIPVLYLYLFAVWALLIAVLAWISRPGEKPERRRPDPG